VAAAASRALDRPEGDPPSLTRRLLAASAVAAARRRAAAVYPQPRTTMPGRCRAEDGCPAHLVGAHRTLSGIAEFGELAFGPGVSWAASTLERPQLDVADHSEVMTPRRFRDTADRAVYSDKLCGAHILSPAKTLDRGDRPSETPGPSVGEQSLRPSVSEPLLSSQLGRRKTRTSRTC